MTLPTLATPLSRVSVEKRTSYAGRKRKFPNTEVKSQESPSSQLMAYILAEKEVHSKNTSNLESSSRCKSCEQHPVDAFLAGIAASLKSLDPVRLLAAKGKIFNVVQEYELQMLTEKRQQNTMAYPIYSSVSPAQTSSASTSSHITQSEDGSHADEYGPPYFPSHIVTTPKSSTIATEQVTNSSTQLSYFQFP